METSALVEEGWRLDLDLDLQWLVPLLTVPGDEARDRLKMHVSIFEFVG